jgi:hypothetical protein
MTDEARIARSDEDDFEAHKKIAVNDEPTDELRREDDEDEVEAHRKGMV